MTYRETVNLGEKVLSMADIAEAKTDAWLLLEMVCKIDRSFYYLHMAEEMPEEQMSEYQIALRKRAEHVPLQYIVGETEFMGLKFKVNSSVLIPRQDTETLVEEALKVVRPVTWSNRSLCSNNTGTSLSLAFSFATLRACLDMSTAYPSTSDTLCRILTITHPDPVHRSSTRIPGRTTFSASSTRVSVSAVYLYG